MDVTRASSSRRLAAIAVTAAMALGACKCGGARFAPGYCQSTADCPAGQSCGSTNFCVGPNAPDGGAATDSGSAADAGEIDSGEIDAGLSDAGPNDAGPHDAGTVDAGAPPIAVTTFANGLTRNGVYIDPAFTKAALQAVAADGGFKPDPTYTATVTGNVYASPLFLERGVLGQDAVFVATEKNNVYAFDTTTGQAYWTATVGPSARKSQLGCGNIDPIGVTSTPTISLARHQMYLDAMNDGPDGGVPVHKVYALNLDNGSIDWSIELDSILTDFTAVYQNNRASPLVDNDILFIPFGGHAGDCGNYHGRVVAIPLSNPVPSAVYEFSTDAYAGAIWAPGGLSSDGTSIFTVTGNAQATPGDFVAPATWNASLGEAMLRISEETLQFSYDTTDYFVPNDWQLLDDEDKDLCSSGIVLFDLPGAGSGKLAFTLGKTKTGWLLDRTNMGGMNTPDKPLAEIQNIATTDATGGMVTYTTPSGTYVGFNAPCWVSGNALGVLKVTPGSPPTLTKAFCVSEGVDGVAKGGSPMVTSSDGLHDMVVWGLGIGGDTQLHAYDGDMGTAIITSTGLSNITHWVSPIVAKGTMYVAGNSQLYAIRMK